MQTSRMGLYLRTIGIGAVAGMRSLTAPALFSLLARRKTIPAASEGPLEALNSPKVSLLLCALAGGELVIDKLPATPSRTIPLSVVCRALSGAVVGAALFDSRRENRAIGAALGALSAVAATYALHALRQTADNKSGLPDPIIGLVEDAVAIGTGLSALR